MLTQTLRSPIRESLQLKGKTTKAKKSVVVPMMLTSLVDAFTIVVIYLIMNSTTSEQIDIEQGLQLPQASHSSAIDASPLVIFKNNQFFINNQIIAEKDLSAKLKEISNPSQGFLNKNVLGKESSIIVQADENVDFEKLQPLLVASSYAGIKFVKFAVLQEE